MNLPFCFRKTPNAREYRPEGTLNYLVVNCYEILIVVYLTGFCVYNILWIMSKIVTFGEIMLRLATPEHQRFTQVTSFNASYGGGEANVAVSLANYGLNAEFVTRLPESDLGRSVIMELRRHGVGTANIIYGGERLGIYFLESGSVSRPSKVLYDRSHSSVSGIRKGMINWMKVFDNASWFHWTGITPAISEGAAEVCLEGSKERRSYRFL